MNIYLLTGKSWQYYNHPSLHPCLTKDSWEEAIAGKWSPVSRACAAIGNQFEAKVPSWKCQTGWKKIKSKIVKSATTISPGLAAPLGSASVADSTARGTSAFCTDRCYGVLSLKLIATCPPAPTIQEKMLEHQSCMPVQKKSRLLGMAGALSLLLPHPVRRQSGRFPSQAHSLLPVHLGRKITSIETQIYQRTAVASAWKRHFL